MQPDTVKVFKDVYLLKYILDKFLDLRVFERQMKNSNLTR